MSSIQEPYNLEYNYPWKQDEKEHLAPGTIRVFYRNGSGLNYQVKDHIGNYFSKTIVVVDIFNRNLDFMIASRSSNYDGAYERLLSQKEKSLIEKSVKQEVHTIQKYGLVAISLVAGGIICSGSASIIEHEYYKQIQQEKIDTTVILNELRYLKDIIENDTQNDKSARTIYNRVMYLIKAIEGGTPLNIAFKPFITSFNLSEEFQELPFLNPELLAEIDQ